MKTIKDTELNYGNGEKMLEGDNVILEYYRNGGGPYPDKLAGVITYKNGAFYIVGCLWEVALCTIIENNIMAHRGEKTIMHVYKQKQS